MQEPSPLMLLLIRTAYLYIITIYSAFTALGFAGAAIGLAATLALAVGSEVVFMCSERASGEVGGLGEEKEKEMRYVV